MSYAMKFSSSEPLLDLTATDGAGLLPPIERYVPAPIVPKVSIASYADKRQ